MHHASSNYYVFFILLIPLIIVIKHKCKQSHTIKIYDFNKQQIMNSGSLSQKLRESQIGDSFFTYLLKHLILHTKTQSYQISLKINNHLNETLNYIEFFFKKKNHYLIIRN